jgi:general secretion pathway protein A
MRCYYGRGNWTTLAFHGLPAVLELRDRSGVRHHGVLSALEASQVTLDLGGDHLTASRQELEPLWFGDFLLLWQAPPGGSPFLRTGSTGPDVVWLQTRLDQVEGRSPPDGSAPEPEFGPVLQERVRAFQQARGLVPDGIVGEQTFIQLSAAAGVPSVPLGPRP